MNAITKMLVAAACATLPLTAMWAQEENPMLTNAMRYIGTPYVAHTLEVEGEEEMTINCDEVDCTTLVEYVLAEAITPKLPNGDVSETAFAENLQRIRYRNGKIGGYTSRLHYASEWIDNAVKAGILEDITATRGTSQAKLQIDYMTTHTELYPKLANADNLIKDEEDRAQPLYTHRKLPA